MTVKKKKFIDGIRLKASSNATTIDGEIRNDGTELKAHLDSSERTVVTEDQTQTVENKTIDGTSATGNNTVTADADDISYDNGVSGLTATDVKAAVDELKTGLDNQNEASEITYDNTTSGLTATDVQAAIDEVEGRVDTNETDIGNNATSISDHIADAADAHDASAISNVPAGNLAATDVQGAVNELQTDIDTRALDADLTAHETDAVGAHAASAIANTPSGNLVATEVQAALNELQTELDGAATSGDLSTHEADTSTHGVTTIAGLDESQTFTNKTLTSPDINTPDIDGGTASDSSRLVLPKNATTSLEGLIDTEALLAFDTTKGKPVFNDGSGWSDIGTGSGTGDYNYIENGTAEVDTIGWTKYRNTVDGPKPDDFGGTPTGSLIFVRSEAPNNLVGDASFNLTRGGNIQGQGVFYSFDAEEGHKTMKHLFRMIKQDTSNYEDGDIGVYLVGSDDSFGSDFLVIEPNNPDILAGTSEVFKQMQFEPTKDKYRLCLHFQTTSTSAFNFYFDDVKFGPSTVATGAVVTDSGIDISSDVGLTNLGNAVVTDATYQRIGDRAFVDMRITIGSTLPTGTLQIDLPSYLNVNTTKSIVSLRSSVYGYDAGLVHDGAVLVTGGGAILNIRGDDGTGNWTATSPLTWADGDFIDISFNASIVGWSSEARMSEDLGNRVVQVNAHLDSDQSITSSSTTQILLDTTTEDTTNSFDTGNNEYVIPETGYYQVNAGVLLTNCTADEVFTLYVRVNGTDKLQTNTSISNTQPMLDVNRSILLNKGDLITLYIDSAVDTSYNVNSISYRTYLNLSKLASPQTILENETVAARYSSNAGSSISTATETDVVFEDLIGDTHNAYNTSTGEYTVPTGGWYDIKSTCAWSNIDLLEGESYYLTIDLNGTQILREAFECNDPNTSNNNAISVHDTYPLVKGDVIKIRIFQNSGTNQNLSSTNARNVFSIARLK